MHNHRYSMVVVSLFLAVTILALPLSVSASREIVTAVVVVAAVVLTDGLASGVVAEAGAGEIAVAATADVAVDAAAASAIDVAAGSVAVTGETVATAAANIGLETTAVGSEIVSTGGVLNMSTISLTEGQAAFVSSITQPISAISPIGVTVNTEVLSLQAADAISQMGGQVFWDSAAGTYYQVTGYALNVSPTSLLTLASGVNKGQQSNHVQTDATPGGVCFGPVNTCGQSYTGQWVNGVCMLPGGNNNAFPPDSGCPAVSCDFWTSPTTVDSGQKAFVLWTCSNTEVCSLDNGYGSVSPSGGYEKLFPTQSMLFNLTCSNSVGSQSYSASITVNQPPPAVGSISVSPTAIVRGDSANLSWNSSGATSCSIDNGIGDVSTSGSVSVSPTITTTYTVTCTGPGGSGSNNTVLTVYQPPTVDYFSPSPAAVARGAASTLSWGTTYTDSCSIDNGIGAVPVNGSVSVSPTVTTTYTITCSGQGGGASRTASLTIYQPPSCGYFSASPNQIVEGTSANLQWGCDNTNTCTIDNGVGTKGANGSVAVSPSHTTTYGMTCTGLGGSTSYGTTLTVYENPVCSFSMSPSSIVPPQTSMMIWSCTKAISCSIDNGIGTVGTSGSSTLAPAHTTTYTLTCLGAGNGTIQARSTFQTTLTVNNVTIIEK